jgi:hypothetical protein
MFGTPPDKKRIGKGADRS